MNKEKVLCPCKKVTKGDVLKALHKGAHSFKDVKEQTGAASKCGKCEDKVRKFVKKHRED